jgi:hypothetical protein
MGAGCSLLLGLSLTAPAALAQTASPAAAASPGTAGIGQHVDFCLASNASTAPSIVFNYPGDNSDIVLDASMTGLASGDVASAGFNVFDVQNTTTPVEIANLANNQAHNNPQLIEFAYGSGTSGPVQIRPFNGSPNQVCFSVTPVQLPSGVTSISLSGGAVAAPGASPKPPAASPAPSLGSGVISGLKSATPNTGQHLDFCIQPNASAAPMLTLNYPGDNTDIVLDANISGQSTGDQTSAGFNVFDAANPNNPVETVNLQRNGAHGDPHVLEFAYSSTNPGPVQIKPYNAGPNPACFSVTPIQLPSGINAINLA